jgi:hypothetical protein
VKNRFEYQKNNQSENVFNAAADLAMFAILAQRLGEKRQRKLLSLAQWWSTEVDGKYGCRYISENGQTAIDARRFSDLRHDHVYRRRDVTDVLLKAKNRKQVIGILKALRGCVVTKIEHDKLCGMDRAGVANGWLRYKRALIKVLDRKLKGRVKGLYRGTV